MTHGTRWLEAFLEAARERGNTRPHMPSAIESGNGISLNPPAGQLRTVVAVSPEQLQAAEQLVRRRYQWRGYRIPPAEDSLAPERREQDLEVTLLAEQRGSLLGTLTVRPDSSNGLLAEQAYRAEIESLRRGGRRVGELVKLAVEKGADWKAALDTLIQSAYLLTRVIHGLTDVLIEINPRHVLFYQRVFGFVVAAAENLCARVGAPSVLMRLDLDQFSLRLPLAAA
jgi:hypothetical protein